MSFIEKYNSLKSAVAKAETEAKEAEIAVADADSDVIRLKSDKAAGENVTAAKIKKATEKRAALVAEVSDLKGVAANLKQRLNDLSHMAGDEVSDLRATFADQAQASMSDRAERVNNALAGESAEPVARLVGEMRMIERLCSRHSIPLEGYTGGKPGQASNTSKQFIFVAEGLPIVIDDALPKVEPTYSTELLDTVGTESLGDLFDLAKQLVELSGVRNEAA